MKRHYSNGRKVIKDWDGPVWSPVTERYYESTDHARLEIEFDLDLQGEGEPEWPQPLYPCITTVFNPSQYDPSDRYMRLDRWPGGDMFENWVEDAENEYMSHDRYFADIVVGLNELEAKVNEALAEWRERQVCEIWHNGVHDEIVWIDAEENE